MKLLLANGEKFSQAATDVPLTAANKHKQPESLSVDRAW